MKLFGNKQRSNLKSTREMVERVISELNLSPHDNQLQTEDGSPAWGLMRGSAQVFIFIKPGKQDDDFNTIQVVSPVMRLPEAPHHQSALFKHLLEINACEITGAAFGLKDETIVIIADRSTQDLDRSEVKDMILRIGYFADNYDDDLVNQYGGKRYSDCSPLPDPCYPSPATATASISTRLCLGSAETSTHARAGGVR